MKLYDDMMRGYQNFSTELSAQSFHFYCKGGILALRKFELHLVKKAGKFTTLNIGLSRVLKQPVFQSLLDIWHRNW